MKWIKIVLVTLAMLFVTNGAIAGSGHDHGPITEARASKISEKVVQEMAQRGELPPSWAKISATSLEKITLDGNMVWRAAFSNKQESSLEKRDLNVYMTLTGGLIKTEHAKK